MVLPIINIVVDLTYIATVVTITRDKGDTLIKLSNNILLTDKLT